MATNKKADVLQQLRDGIAALTDSTAWQRYLDVQHKFHQYSWGNCLLITLQRPDATRVAGYHAWQKLGRQVQVGERGINILAPIVYKQAANDEQSTESPELRVLRAFRTASVFDVSQTKGEPLPEIATRLLGDEPIHAFRRLQSVAGELAFHVDITTLPGSRNGDCNFVDRVIRLRDDIAPAQMVKTLAHELGHVMLHFPSELPSQGLSRELKELEAESVAYVVCHELGLDSSLYSFGYIAHWAGDGYLADKGIETSAARINKAAHTILSVLERGDFGHESRIALPRSSVAEPLSDDMRATTSVNHGSMNWPEPLHHVNGQVVPSLLLTVPEACTALRVSRAQLYVMANKQRVIEMVHIGKLCRIPRASIEAYVEQLRGTASLQPTHGDFGLGDGEGA
jgi:excisionase family DNA binding protein